MKRLALLSIMAVLVTACAFAQVVLYQDTATLEWDAITTDSNGDPLLPGDTVSYDVYIYDNNAPPADVQDIALLTYYGTTSDTSMLILFPDRREWVVGVRGTITDGGGNTGDPSRVAWSLISGDVDIATMGGPFYYAPLVPTAQPSAPTNLRDSGM